MVRDLLRWRRAPAEDDSMEGLEAERARALLAHSRERFVILDERDRIVAASPGGLAEVPGLHIGAAAPEGLLRRSGSERVEYEVDGRREVLLRLPDPEPTEYEELRSGFTAVVSHELRTPLARLMALLETASVQGSSGEALVDQAQGEVEQIRELIDEILFLSELETGLEVVSLGMTQALPVAEEVLAGLAERADRAGLALRVEGDANIALPLRPRMLRVVIENLAENAIRYAGPDATFRLSVDQRDAVTILRAADDGAGVADSDLPRLFERFYRADRARASRGTGLGLAIVKHIVNSAGGTVEATVPAGGGLEVICLFAR